MNRAHAILVCTLGASWAVIPEILGFVAPEILPLFDRHPSRERLAKLRRDWNLPIPEEIWVVTTEGEKTTASLRQLAEWWKIIRHPMPLRVWQAAGTNELAGEEECARIRELTLRLVLRAGEEAGGVEQVMLSLAGGRKTMSADLQRAGTIFGCGALLHVVDNGEMPQCLREAVPEFLAEPLPEMVEVDEENKKRMVPCAGVVTPLVVGRGYRSELLDVEWEGRGPVDSSRFPLPAAPEINSFSARDSFSSCHWEPGEKERKNRLDEEVAAREKEGQQLLSNYLAAIAQRERHENWRSLYRLPPRIIRRLQQARMGEEHCTWLRSLPKAELHCHLGGILDIPAQKRVGEAVWQALPKSEREAALKRVGGMLRAGEWDWDWPERLKIGNRTANCAALLVYLDPETLSERLYAGTEPRFALQNSSVGFAAYERPGELSGSAILGHEAAVAVYAGEVYDFLVREGVAYCELRGSPLKYLAADNSIANGLKFLRLFRQGVQQARKAGRKTVVCGMEPEIRFIVIADRRNAPLDMKRINLAADLVIEAVNDPDLKDFVVGLDLAGQEKTGDLDKIKKTGCLERLFKNCLPVTVHAGEGTNADMIWQAAYHLNADRIGHGLKLVDNEELACRFRNRSICLELCPTSNLEVVGFRRSRDETTADYEEYPLSRLWEMGLPLTLCTDNPGISRTTLTNEYIVASRDLAPSGISLWDGLAMIKQAFSHAFLPAAEREEIMKRADYLIYRSVCRSFPDG
jgi:adenosine deaminase